MRANKVNLILAGLFLLVPALLHGQLLTEVKGRGKGPKPRPTPTVTPTAIVYAGEVVRLNGPKVYMVPGTYTDGGTAVTVKPIGAVDSIYLTDSGDAEINKQNLTAALQTAAANPNENEIVIPAGMVINDTVYLPNRSFNTYVTVRSSRSGELTGRATKADRDKMFRLNARAAGNGVENFALAIREGSNYFRFVGMEIVRSGGFKNDVIFVDYTTTARPSHLIFDRILIDGNGTDTIRAFAPNGEYFSLLNSSIYDIKSIGNESKAIGMWSGKGALAVVNNYLEAASINTLLGGAYTDAGNLIDGVVFRNNDSWKNPDWLGKGYAIKNLFELKQATNVIAENNTFTNNWIDGQSGPSILFTVRGSGQPLSTVQHVWFRNNLVLSVQSGVNILPSDDESPSGEVANIFIENNRFLDVGDRVLVLLPQPEGQGRNIHFKHNTVRMRSNAGALVMMDGVDGMQIFIESNDFGFAGLYGVFGSGYGEGTVGMVPYLSGDSTFLKNLISFDGRDNNSSAYPSDNYFSFINSDSYNPDGTPYSHIVGTDGVIVGSH